MSGRVVVFAPARDFSAVTAGQPVRFPRPHRPADSPRPDRRSADRDRRADTGATPADAAGGACSSHGVRRRARDVLPADQAAMLPALVLGDTSAVTAADHRGVPRGRADASDRGVRRQRDDRLRGGVVRRRGWSARGPRWRWPRFALVAFVVVVQPSASVLRAAVMGAITLLAILSSRRRQAIPALSATVLVLMIAAPQLAVDVGFALVGVGDGRAGGHRAGLVATAGGARLAQAAGRRGVRRACAAQLVTAPLVAGISGSVSLVAVAANLAVAARDRRRSRCSAPRRPRCACLAGRGAAADPVHRTGIVVAAAASRSGRPACREPRCRCRRAVGGGARRRPLAGVAAVLVWRWRWFRGATRCGRAGARLVASGGCRGCRCRP